METKTIRPLIGLIMVKVEKIRTTARYPYFGLEMTTDQGDRYRLGHNQSCCEDVSLEDVAGELAWLENSPILHAYETTERQKFPEELTSADMDWYGEACTWSFYHLATVNGTVCLRWYGSSNGYYSEKANLYKYSVEDEHWEKYDDDFEKCW